MGVPTNRSHIRTSPVTISIHDLFSTINPKDINFLKYIPNEFLSEEQIDAKRMSLQTNDGVKFYDRKNLKNNYWYPNISKSEIATVRRIVKYELSTTENYIDNNTKWLYNERNGKTFLLYIALQM